MAWLMFKDSGTYQYRGKKCDGFANKAKGHIDLSWGMDNLDAYQKQHIKSSINTANLAKSTKTTKILPAGVYQKKSEQQQLDKIMKVYQSKKMTNIAGPTRVMQPNMYQHPTQRRPRSDTQQSYEKIRNLENSLIPVAPSQTFHRRDTMGYIINQDASNDFGMSESRVSRRSVTGNKKNQSKVVFGDVSYNDFIPKAQKKKDFHQQLMDMYEYQDKKKNRKISQIAI